MVDRVLQQLQAANVLSQVKDLVLHEKSVRFTASEDLKRQLDADDRFLSGIFYGLHTDVGDDLIDYRSIGGTFGKGSMQIVLDRKTYCAYADVDSHSPYDDVWGTVAHMGVVIAGGFKKLFGRK